MSTLDDDATITQLATAWVALALVHHCISNLLHCTCVHECAIHLARPAAMQGGAKVQEASYIYQELGDKYCWTVCGLAAWLERSNRHA